MGISARLIMGRALEVEGREELSARALLWGQLSTFGSEAHAFFNRAVQGMPGKPNAEMNPCLRTFQAVWPVRSRITFRLKDDLVIGKGAERTRSGSSSCCVWT